jgi:hypothetical protein
MVVTTQNHVEFWHFLGKTEIVGDTHVCQGYQQLTALHQNGKNTLYT